MDEQELNEQTQEQEQNSADFLSGFNSARSPDEESPEPKRVEKEAAAEVAPEQPAEEAAKDESQGEPDEPMFFGMTESQIKSLLERSARVDDIENQLRKAHGKIGELNANFQNLSTQQKPTQSAPATQVEDGELDQLEQDFPELARIAEAKARKIAAEMIGEMTGKAPAQSPSMSDADIQAEINMAILDATNEGWREKISSQDFKLWIATQPADVQETFDKTNSAKELGKVIKDFDGWKTSTQDRSIRNKQRLEAAVTPSGSSAKISHAPSAQDEFLAGFNSVRNQY